MPSLVGSEMCIRDRTAVHHLFDDSNLLVKLLVGVGVVGIDNAGGVL